MAAELDQLLINIRDLVCSARSAAVQVVDALQVMTYYRVGHLIVEHEQQGLSRAQYGSGTLKLLAEKLTVELGRGFSRTNLEYMRKFYLAYRDRLAQKSQMPSGELSKPTEGLDISQMGSGKSWLNVTLKQEAMRALFPLSWSQYVFLLGIDSVDERQFYEFEAASNTWTLPELKRQFNSSLYERLALSRNKVDVKNLAKEGQKIVSSKDLLRDPYVLEFLGLEERAHYSEQDLESAIIDKLEHFLLELGKGFLFEARQKRITLDGDHFFVDLVFYNRLLRSYVLVDLKIGKLTHQDLGQMQMYVNYFDQYVKQEDEAPTIGIVLCKMKSDALVEITLPKQSNITAARYQLVMPNKEELKRKLMDWMEEIPLAP